jgi:hypothetical protein
LWFAIARARSCVDGYQLNDMPVHLTNDTAGDFTADVSIQSIATVLTMAQPIHSANVPAVLAGIGDSGPG